MSHCISFQREVLLVKKSRQVLSHLRLRFFRNYLAGAGLVVFYGKRNYQRRRLGFSNPWAPSDSERGRLVTASTRPYRTSPRQRGQCSGGGLSARTRGAGSGWGTESPGSPAAPTLGKPAERKGVNKMKKKTTESCHREKKKEREKESGTDGESGSCLHVRMDTQATP